MKIKGLAHIAFNVTSIERSLDFYCNKLGLRQVFSMTYADLLQMLRSMEKATQSNTEGVNLLAEMERSLLEKQDQLWMTYLEFAPGQFIELFATAPGTPISERNPQKVGYQHFALEKDYGDIVKILFDEASAQLFLVTHNGYLVTLPDCPQCVRARHISDLPLVDGKIDGKKIVMTDTSGGTVCYSLYVAVEYRCAWSFAKPHLGKDGIVLDLQNTEEDTLPGAVRISAEEADMLLNHFPKETFLFFVCEFGRKADEAVRDARSMGFRNSYSLGSAYSVLQQIREESM